MDLHTPQICSCVCVCVCWCGVGGRVKGIGSDRGSSSSNNAVWFSLLYWQSINFLPPLLGWCDDRHIQDRDNHGKSTHTHTYTNKQTHKHRTQDTYMHTYVDMHKLIRILCTQTRQNAITFLMKMLNAPWHGYSTWWRYVLQCVAECCSVLQCGDVHTHTHTYIHTYTHAHMHTCTRIIHTYTGG